MQKRLSPRVQMTDQWDSSLYDDRHSFVWKKVGELIELLDAKSDERILDLGCGTGHLTAQIAARGASVTGLDSSVSMIAQARQNFPKLKFVLADARSFHFDQPFDAVFSNAALHWIPDAGSVIASVARALKLEYTPGKKNVNQKPKMVIQVLAGSLNMVMLEWIAMV